MEREIASTAPISQPSQYMTATTRQITPVQGQNAAIYTHDANPGVNIKILKLKNSKI